MEKLRNSKGESLIETLVATLIIAAVLIMLAGSIVSAAKVNKKTKTLSTEFKLTENYPDDYTVKTIKITNNVNRLSNDVEIKYYETKDKNHYRFYSILK